MTEQLETLVAAQQWNEALTLALVLWRRTRALELAELIDWLGERTDTPALKSHGAPEEAFHTVWCERLRTLGSPALRVLLPTLRTKLPERRDGRYYILGPEDYRRWHGALFERLQALADAPADPRIARRLATLIAEMEIDHLFSHDAYRIAFRALAQIADTRTLTSLHQAEAGQGITREHFRNLFSSELPGCIEAIESRARASEPLDAPTRERIAALCPKPKASPESLLEQVLADPKRLDLRHVWADALLERGDPRGEFVALQLKPDGLTGDEAKRMASLQRKHQREWLGGLANILKASTVRFEAGCLVEAELAEPSAASPDEWRRLSGERSLVTLKRLRRNSNADVYLTFLCSPLMESLEAAEVSNNPMLARLVDSKAATKIRQLTIEKTLNAETFDLLERLPRLEAIHLARGVKGGAYRKELDRRNLQRVALVEGTW